MARGKLPSNPGLREHRPEAIRAVSVARERLYLDELITSAQLWLPTVRRMRPAAQLGRRSSAFSTLRSSRSWRREPSNDALSPPALIYRTDVKDWALGCRIAPS
jgi:hypothetical protein